MSHTQDSCPQDDLEECAQRLALLQRRLDAAHSTRDRVHDLMEVVTSVGRDLDLEHVLRHVVQAATTLVRARYGALGVIGPDHEKLVQFLTVGMDDEDVTYAGPHLDRPFPPVLFVFAPAPRRAAPDTREAAFHERARNVGSVNYKLTVATTTLPLLTKAGAGNAVWRVVGKGHGEERRTLAALPKAR
ncbi:hypothetical protein [Streptomyces sp. 09ZI22]|uniref:hypothetical protein n=1 Tax=Streptomyces sp. 09ZI22 TaxID=2856603 RepID=UPI0027D9E9C5|nr:hypothetical protein [Streptomyces sp. 09ZI22]